MANVLVTGGAGFIGSHACKCLAAAGHLPITLDNLVHGHRWAVRWGPLIHGDLGDRELLDQAMRQYRIDAVMHFAAYAYVGESMTDPGRYFGNNVSNTLNLLDTMVRFGVQHFVFSSTCATYGLPEHNPIVEQTPQAPVNPYGESKLFVEKALHWYESAHALKHAALRYFNAAGADPDGEIGEAHDPETHLIPLVIQAALGQRSRVDIYGTDYDTPDGTAVRDYIHVSDLAHAHVLALEHLQSSQTSVALNLGTGKGYSVRDIVTFVENLAGRRVPVWNAPRRPGDPANLVADAMRARQVLEWYPAHSSLEAIVQTAWDWHLGQRSSQRAVPGGIAKPVRPFAIA